MDNMLNSVTITKAKDLITEALTSYEGIPPNIMLHGSMGLGKSSIVRQVGEELGYRIIDLRLSGLESSDVQGIPYVYEGEMMFSTPSWWPKDGEKVILFLDEITNCSVSVQHAAYRLILDRSIQNGKVLGDEVAIIAAGNLKSDRTGAKELLPAANNRFAMHLFIDSKRAAKSFLDWSMSNGIDKDIVAFLSWKEECVFIPPESGEPAFPTPRSWESASKLKKNHNGDDADLSIKIASSVGSAAAVELMSFIEYNQFLPNWKEMKENEAYSYDMPKNDTAMMYALSVAMAFETINAIDESDVDYINKLATMVGSLDDEIKTVFFRTLKRKPESAYQLVKYESLRDQFKTVSKFIR